MTSQLSLFTRRRAAKPPPVPEFHLHCVVADLLRQCKQPGWVWFHVPNGEARDEIAGGRLKRMGTRRGVSDFVLIAPPNGRAHVLELKRRGCKPTTDQYSFLLEVEEAGGVSAWVDSFDQALAVLKRWGAVRASVSA
jgi:hypothetical protein